MKLSLVPIVNRLVLALGAPVKAARVPHQSQSLAAMFDLGFIGQGRGREQQLRSDVTSGWLFAVIDRIATSIMAVEWALYSGKGKEDRVLVDRHPLLDLWEKPNPFHTREAFLELSMGYFDLVGEIWWLVVRGPNGEPEELWALRPDRMRVIPHPTEYIAGYEYRLGMEKIPLSVDDIIFIRRPSKWDAYRGVSPLQSIMFDLEGEQFASRYYRNFFSNSAAPGGVLETPDTMDDDELARFVQEWRSQHQGASNAHRVAVLEGGVTWKDVKQATGRDMQMVESRKFNRDLIFGAYGIAASVMGITENVNLANAESGQEGFQRDTVKPRLVRLRGSLNRHLVPMFAPTSAGTDLFFDFDDPVPENRELNRQDAVEGFNAGILTRNEARGLMEFEDVADGDDFKVTTPPPSFDGDEPPIASLTVASAPLPEIVAGWHGMQPFKHEKVYAYGEWRLKAKDAPEAPDPDDPAYLVDAEAVIRRGWEKRLEAEAEAIGDYFEPFFKSRWVYTGHGEDRTRIVKIEPADVDGYAWDTWFAKYGDDVIDELTEAFVAIISEAVLEGTVLESELQRRAADYARQRGAALLQLEGDVNLIEYTRDRVRQLVAQTIERGDSLGALKKALREDLAFSKSRASTVARTETREALGEGQIQGAGIMGQNEKKWVTQGDMHVDDPCLKNAGVSWIKIETAFPNGRQRVPEHPNCRCNVIYRTVDPETAGWVGRCEDCQKVLVKAGDQVAEDRYCPRCKKVKALDWRREDD